MALYHDLMLTSLLDSALNVGDMIWRIATRAGRRVRRPILITVGGLIALFLLIALLQSGIGVDSDETITDRQRPEIVGD